MNNYTVMFNYTDYSHGPFFIVADNMIQAIIEAERQNYLNKGEAEITVQERGSLLIFKFNTTVEDYT